MKHTAKYTSLDRIIYEYISQAELTAAHYLRLWPIAVRGLKELGVNVAGEPITRKLNVLPNKTVELPSDYVTWSKIGVLNERGEVATLTHNRDLSLYAAADDDRLSYNTDSSAILEPGDNDYRNFYHNDQCFQLFGVPAGFTYHGEFKVDDVQGLIVLNNDFRYDYVILEYLQSPEANGDYMVSDNLTEALIAWLAWQDIAYKPAGRRSNGQEKMIRRKNYYNERNLARVKESPFRIQDFNEIFQRGVRGSLK